MGIELGYDVFRGKWYLKGFGFKWYFDTKHDAENHKHDAWEKHKANLEAHRWLADMLTQMRYM